ncbi:MAG: aminoacyl-histidine dipeptidase, partial [Clostridiales bacterium]|nr:aminoacyl-histidine dipeptidase [Clostridiales bacterium]
GQVEGSGERVVAVTADVPLGHRVGIGNRESCAGGRSSANPGILRMDDKQVILHVSVRSSVQTIKEYMIDLMINQISMLGGKVNINSQYPAWEYKMESELRDKMIRVYERMYGQKMKVEAVHAGLECGILSDKCPELDCVSFGPQMFHIHTPKERLSISSANRVWEYLVTLLAEK